MSAKRDKAWLRSLTVDGFGLIDRARVELASGLVVFTGETGSGKSMVIDALGVAFGDRASADVIRAGAEKASAFAEAEPNAAVSAWLGANGFEGDDGEPLIVSREITRAGRSGARINGKPATAAQLKELGDLLLDVVGQHEHTHLAQPSRHMDLLDAFGGPNVVTLREKVAATHAQVVTLRDEIEDLERSEASVERKLADARYAADEIAAARLVPGELESLLERRAVVADAARIADALATASAALGSADSGATATLGRVARALEPLASISAKMRDLAEQAKGLQSTAQDLTIAVASLADEGVDASQLDEIESRLALIERLQRKHGSDIAGIISTGERFAAEVQAFERRDERLTDMRKALPVLDRELAAVAGALSAVRRESAATLGARVSGELAELGMRGSEFRCAVEPRHDGVGASGADRVEFLASLNPNEPERPVARSASGGELSRLLLALKVALADVDPHPVVVLDEIDAGIGGDAARRVGERISFLARSVQVLCVTHLAQIAAFADRHVALEKKTKNGRAVVSARVLESGDDVRMEIARMLSGDSSRPEALRHAQSLLDSVRDKPQKTKAV